MLFLLATPEYSNLQSNTTKVKVHLRSGVAEIFEQHQDLMGKVENNIIEIETNFENKFEKSLFILRQYHHCPNQNHSDPRILSQYRRYIYLLSRSEDHLFQLVCL
jgi:hypothetical protein